MTTRRQLLHAGLALPVLPSSLLAMRRAAAYPALSLERFVFDRRFDVATEVATHVAARGVPLSAIAGDLTELWYHELDLRWKRAPAPLAGVTTGQGLFVLETLAADHRMRVVYRGEHGAAADGRVRHRLVGPEALLARWGDAPAELAWPTLGAALAECPPLSRGRATTCERITAANPAPLRDEPLLSWIIAPRSMTATRV